MSNHPEPSQKYRIKSVAGTTGLSTHVIRKWEQRYHLLHPQRGPNGYRLYTEDDIQFLLYLKSQLEKGESIGQLAQSGEHDLRQSMLHTPLNLSGIPPMYRNDAQEIIRLARLQDVPAITTLLENWIGRMGLEGALDIIIFPLLRLLGDLWHQGGISFRGEESVSRLVRQHLINVLREEPPPGGPHALIACVHGDFHEIGPLTAALLLRDIGWHSLYLGPSVSFEMLKTALHRKHAELMILACNIEPAEETLQSWLQDITQHLQPSCSVIVGGPGFRPYAHLLSTRNISYFNHVQDVKAFKPRTRISHIKSAVGHLSFTPWVS